MAMSVCSRVRRMLVEFGRSDRGNVGVIFAIALVPLLGFVGAAVDYSLVSRARTAMQNALDTAALMVARDAATNNWTASQVTTAAQNYFNGMYNHPEVTNVSITAAYNTGSGAPTVVLTGAGSMATNFMKMVGTPTMSFNLSSTVSWGQSRLRVALVLDNTGSMNDNGKIGALKTATASLLDQLNAAATNNGDVYVSIIPFVKDVNLGTSNYSATWIDWTDWDLINGSCSSAKWNDKTTCLSKNKVWTPDNHNTWNGCVVDRGDASAPNAGNYDTNVVAPSSGSQATLYSAEQYTACPQATMGLSYDWTSMKTLVNNMVANGNTNQAIGLQLGWLSLAGGGPFTAPAMTSGYTYQQVIIILTDGLNTQDRWYTNQSSIDARQQLTCNNIKAAGITLYTIQVDTGGDPTSTLLQNCATDASKFFLLTSANQILTTFNSIGTQISKLHVAR
jgi:Flp pilus assembly protein TadG